MSTSQDIVMQTVRVGDIDMSFVERNPERRGQGPTVLFVHATGFHCRLWDEIADQLTEFHSIAVSQRGHGLSTGEPVSHWRTFSDDLAGFIEALDLRNIVGVGHSMGGHASIDVAARISRYVRIIAIDPVIAEPAAYENEGLMGFSPDNPHPAIKRKRDFASSQEMIERFENREPYSLFTRASLENYCVHGLVKKPEGGHELACAPEMEASVYMTSRTNAGIFDSAHALEIPVLIIRARREEGAGAMNFAASPTWPGLAGEFKNARDLHMPDRTHFIPMEIPNEVVRIIREEIASR